MNFDVMQEFECQEGGTPVKKRYTWLNSKELTRKIQLPESLTAPFESLPDVLTNQVFRDHLVGERRCGHEVGFDTRREIMRRRLSCTAGASSEKILGSKGARNEVFLPPGRLEPDWRQA